MFRLILTDGGKNGKRQLTDFIPVLPPFFGIVPNGQVSLQFAERCFIIGIIDGNADDIHLGYRYR